MTVLPGSLMQLKNQRAVGVGKVRGVEERGCAKKNVVPMTIKAECCLSAFRAWYILRAE